MTTFETTFHIGDHVWIVDIHGEKKFRATVKNVSYTRGIGFVYTVENAEGTLAGTRYASQTHWTLMHDTEGE